VVFVDGDADRCALAERLGAEVVQGPPPRRAGAFAITVDCSGDPAGLACALRSVEPYGVCTGVAVYFGDTAVPLLEMYTRGVRFVTGRVNACPLVPAILDAVRVGTLHPEVVNSDLVPWDAAADAMVADLRKPVFVRDA
jgi:alcohol dehydrogenase